MKGIKMRVSKSGQNSNEDFTEDGEEIIEDLENAKDFIEDAEEIIETGKWI